MRFSLNKFFPIRSLAADETGSSVTEVALITPVFLLALAGGFDLGQAYLTNTRVNVAAHSAALYGVQYPTDSTGITAAASTGSGTIGGMTVAIKTGCECSDGSGASDGCTTTPSCSVHVIDYVDVTTSAVYNAVLPYPGLPSSYTLTGRSRLRTAHNGG